MAYVLYPYKGFCCDTTNAYVELGMTSKEIKSLLNISEKDSMLTMEYFNDFRVDYDNENKAIAFEFFSNAKVTVYDEILEKLKGVDLFSVSFKSLNKLLLNLDGDSTYDGSGVISLNIGIGTYNEDSDEDRCETIIIFKKGYYNSIK